MSDAAATTIASESPQAAPLTARRYWRLVQTLLLPSERRKAVALAGAGLLVSTLEIAGVLAVLPLAQTLGSETATIPPSAAWIAGRLADPTHMQVIGALAAVVAGLFLVRSLVGIAVLRASLRLTSGIEARVATECFARYLDMPFQLSVTINSAEIVRTLHDSMRRVFPEALGTLISSFGDRLVVAGSAFAMVLIAPLETLAGAAITALAGLAYGRLARRTVALTSGTQLAATRSSILQSAQTISALREIRLAGTRGYFVERFGATRAGIADTQRIIVFTEQLPRYLLEIGLIAVTGVVATIAFMHRPQAEAVGILGLCMVAGLRLLPSLNRITVSGGKVAVAGPALAQVIEAVALPTHRPTQSDELSAIEGRLRLSEVSFTYGATPQLVLDGITIDVEPGESLGIIGPSGAGKTTLLGLILGFLDPTSGAITVGGVDLSAQRVGWQRRIGYVPQEVALLDDTLRANIELGDPSRGEEALRSALRDAQLEELIASLPEGLESRVGERGAHLSGGQRQRLGLARALYRDPSVLVLDEATSALDAAAERQVIDTIRRLSSSLTTIWVTHRIAAVRHCNQVVLLDSGRMQAAGTWEELSAAGLLPTTS